MPRISDEHTEEEKNAALALYFSNVEKRYFKGRVIANIMAFLNVAFAVGMIIASFDIIVVFLQICLSAAVLNKVKWVRYYFILGTAITAMYYAKTFSGGSDIFNMVIRLSSLIFMVVMCIFLFANRCVSEYMYQIDNG